MASIPKSNRATHYVVWGSAVILIALAVYAVHTLTNERVSVRTARVTYQDLVKSFSTNGIAEPIHDFQAHAQAPGQVEEVYVDVGDKVKPGQVLLKLDDSAAAAELARAESTLKADELAAANMQHGGSQDERNTFNADLSRATFQRQQDAAALATAESLQASGADSAAEVAAARHRVEVDDNNIRNLQTRSAQRYAPDDLATAQAQVEQAKAAVAAAQDTYSSVVIRSPIAGTVYRLPVSQHDYVTTGDNSDLVYVADLNHLRITAYFDEPDIGNLAVDQPVTIKWDAKPDLTWHGHISQVPSTVISYLTRFIGEAIITVDDASPVLEPNANVNVTVTTARHPHVLCVPREALKHDATGYYVFRIVNDKLVRTSVQLGTPDRPSIVNLDLAEITSGLSEGDTVALNATTNRDLTNGLEVTPVD